MTNKIQLKNVFSANRAEESGDDVWPFYVVPHFYEKLDLIMAKKPRIIIGGRGCGKTMLLKYLSHRSVFSKTRQNIPENALEHIGLYWRFDTQLCNIMKKRGEEEDVWDGAFQHYAALIIAKELLNSLLSVGNSNFEKVSVQYIEKLDFSKLKSFDSNIPSSFSEFNNYLEQRYWEFTTWLNNVKSGAKPNYFPGVVFIQAMISVLKTQISIFEKAVFYVYLDEYENLLTSQQKIVNTWLKHSQVPLIFNLAMKKNAFETKETTGTEQISDIHDYRQHDLEDLLDDKDFLLLAAEITIMRLGEVGFGKGLINETELHSPEALNKRKEDNYRKRVLESARSVFPDMGTAEMANVVMKDKVLAGKLAEKIKYALKKYNSSIPVDQFMSSETQQLSMASIIIPALLSRPKSFIDEVLSEYNKLREGKDNQFTGTTAWLQNNFIGCLLQLYMPYSKHCPFYSGFDTFCKLSKGNIRHFLELCHKSLLAEMATDESYLAGKPISFENQAIASRQTSSQFLGEIKSFGRYGNNLHTFVMRVGRLFNLAHQRPSQSESEQSHFSITKGEILDEVDFSFLQEAVKWSVLFEYEETKKKEGTKEENSEYVLNPIYAPYFYISYRKKRKLELSTSEFKILRSGDLSSFSKLLRGYSSKWEVEEEAKNMPLFPVLGDQ